jgi:2-phosphosulfolactate phosphatase
MHRFKIVVLVDVFRSSSTIISALGNGAKAVFPFTNLRKAMKFRKRTFRDAISVGERKGITPKNFDYNISPFVMKREIVSGRTILFSSSNLTRVLGKLRKDHEILIGGIINAKAVAAYLQFRNVDAVIVPCGTRQGTAIEDLAGAGAIAVSLEGAEFSDDALAAIGLFRARDWKGLVKRGHVANRLIKLGFEKDVEFCLSVDSSTVVPRLVGNRILSLQPAR